MSDSLPGAAWTVGPYLGRYVEESSLDLPNFGQEADDGRSRCDLHHTDTPEFARVPRGGDADTPESRRREAGGTDVTSP